MPGQISGRSGARKETKIWNGGRCPGPHWRRALSVCVGNYYYYMVLTFPYIFSWTCCTRYLCTSVVNHFYRTCRSCPVIPAARYINDWHTTDSRHRISHSLSVRSFLAKSYPVGHDDAVYAATLGWMRQPERAQRAIRLHNSFCKQVLSIFTFASGFGTCSFYLILRF